MRSSATQSGNINKKYQEMNFELENLFTGLTQNPGLEKIDVIIKNEALNVLLSKIMDGTVGTEAKMTVCFIKIVSSLLALVSAVRQNNFERHLQQEREMVKYCFAFNHINCAYYGSYQHVYLRELQGINNNAMMNLAQRSFGDSLSGDSFSWLCVVITKILNEQTKRQAAFHCARFSTDIPKGNTWIATSHIHAKVRETLLEKNIIKYKLGS